MTWYDDPTTFPIFLFLSFISLFSLAHFALNEWTWARQRKKEKVSMLAFQVQALCFDFFIEKKIKWTPHRHMYTVHCTCSIHRKTVDVDICFDLSRLLSNLIYYNVPKSDYTLLGTSHPILFIFICTLSTQHIHRQSKEYVHSYGYFAHKTYHG